MELQVLSKSASRLWNYAYKKYKIGNSAIRTTTQCHIRPPYPTAEFTISVQQYPENYQK